MVLGRVVKKWSIVHVVQGIDWRDALMESYVRFRLSDLRMRYKGVREARKKSSLVDLFPDF